MEDIKQTPNVFNLITADIPQTQCQQRIEEFRSRSDKFQSFLDIEDRDYLTKPTAFQPLDSYKYELKYDSSTNQRLLASKKQIKTGTLLMRNNPLVSLLSKENIKTHCSYCFRQQSSLRVCSQCSFVYYCNQSCQKAHWQDHKYECKLKKNLKDLPQPLRFLLHLLWKKTNAQHNEFMRNLKVFNEQISTMISNAGKALFQSEQKKEEIFNYAMVAFLRTPELQINLNNFQMIVHLYFISQCNSFGIADSQMLRIGSGLYYPSNLINHSCEPNCVSLFRDNQQFILSCRDIAEGDELTLCYVDNGIEDQSYRNSLLRDQYYFSCVCNRCKSQQVYQQDLAYQNPINKLTENYDNMDQLNQEALNLEQAGQYGKSLKVVDQMIEVTCCSSRRHYSNIVKKELYERASFLCIRAKDYGAAVRYQKELVLICDQMYIFDQVQNETDNTSEKENKLVVRDTGDEHFSKLIPDHFLPHPLLALHYYQLGKLLSQIDQYKLAVNYLQKAYIIIDAYYSTDTENDGAINQLLVNEVRENLLANTQLVK